MKNLRMAEAIKEGECLDIREIGKPVPGTGEEIFELDKFIDGKDYCDAQREWWVWSIGQGMDGKIFAAFDTRFFRNPQYECLWLR